MFQHPIPSSPSTRWTTSPTEQEHHAPAAQQEQQSVHLHWSHFKREFSGKPDEDTEAHLLHTDGWMNTHHFVEGDKLQRFCLTLL